MGNNGKSRADRWEILESRSICLLKNNKAGFHLQKAGFVHEVAEREGFEPSMELSPHTRLAGERLQPARPSLRNRRRSAGNMCFPYVDLISSLQHWLPAVSLLSDKWFGGGSRIRTHGGVTLNGFQDRRFRPLSHPSRTTAHFLPSAAMMVNQFVGLHSAVPLCLRARI